MSNKGEKFTREFVMGFGFLSGIFLAVGVDPEGEIIKVLIELLSQYNPELALTYSIIFGIISILILIVTIFASYNFGGIIGLIAIFCAFLGGLIILFNIYIGFILLLIGLFLGPIAPDHNYRPF